MNKQQGMVAKLEARGYVDHGFTKSGQVCMQKRYDGETLIIYVRTNGTIWSNQGVKS